jgi:sulfate permease, SulP family
MNVHKVFERLFIVWPWLKGYSRPMLAADAVAAAVVTLLLIPQALAYALLAGMPPVTGLYASVLPLLVYALMGSSMSVAVGPAALRSIMSMAAVAAVVAPGTASFVVVSGVLALMVGSLLLLMGLLRMGFVAGFLSHPVLTGFVTASGLLIAMSQLGHVMGVQLPLSNAWVFAHTLWSQATQLHTLTLLVGLATWAALAWGPRLLAVLCKGGWANKILIKAWPLWVMLMAVVASAGAGWATQGVAVLGHVPQGLPALALPLWSEVPASVWGVLLLPAVLIALLTFVEQVSVAQTLAARRRERVDVNAEMRAMGGANMAAGLSGAFAVGASFSRSVVAHQAGAQTPMAGLLTALLVLGVALWLTPVLFHLPLAVLAAIILVAIGGLLDWRSFAKTWRYSKADFAAQLLTFGVTLGVDLVSGLMAGVVASLLLHIWHSSRPHIATVGNVPGTEHYRSVLRHAVTTQPHVLGLRPDESLFFANARFLEDHVVNAVAQQPQVRHVVLQCTAVNDIDASGLQSLEVIQQRLYDMDVALHLSEVKGPVMDRLQGTDFLKGLTGQVFLTHHQAVQALESEANQAP